MSARRQRSAAKRRAAADEIVVVASVRTQRPLLEELARELQNCRASTLGVVLTGVPLNDRYV